MPASPVNLFHTLFKPHTYKPEPETAFNKLVQAGKLHPNRIVNEEPTAPINLSWHVDLSSDLRLAYTRTATQTTLCITQDEQPILQLLRHGTTQRDRVELVTNTCDKERLVEIGRIANRVIHYPHMIGKGKASKAVPQPTAQP